MTFSDTKRLLGGVATQIGEKNLSLIAAGVAFFGMLALFPAMAAIIAIWGLMSDPHVLIEQLDLIRNLLPDEVVRLIENQINALSTTSGDKLVTLSAVVIVPIIFAIVPLGPITALMVEAFRWCAAIFVLMAGLAVIYRYGPNNRGERLRWITPGAVLAVALWAVASYGFSLYLTNFGNYNEVYGSIGAAVAMLMWLFISAFLILLGAVVNLQLTAIAPPAADAKGS